MKKLLPLVALAVFFCTQAFSQEATFNFLEGEVTIDGVADEAVWSDAHITEIVPEKFYRDEVPSLTDVSVKAFWNDTAIFVMITATDDIWAPSWVTGGNAYEADELEVYFDVNEVLVDGLGTGSGSPDWLPYQEGHYQFAPNWSETDPGVAANFNGATWAGTYDGTDDGSFTAEYAVPFSVLLDKTGTALDPMARPTIGFDVTLIDNDDGAADPTNRQRLVWSNDGGMDENWRNMDEAGVVTLDATSYVSVETNNVENLSVYPTFASDYINLPAELNSVEIFNSLGQRIKLVNNPGSILDISSIQAGLHFVRVTKDSNQSITKIFIE